MDYARGVTCGNCGAENPQGQKFCGECGTALASGCPNCGATNPPGQKFCGDCGVQLAAGSAAASIDSFGMAATLASATGSGLPATTAFGQPPGGGAFAGGARSVPAGASGAELRLVSVLFTDLVGFTPFAEERDAEDVRDTLTRYFDIASDVVSRHGGTVEKFIGDAVMAVWGTPTAREDDAERAVRAALELVASVRSLGSEIQARAAVLTGEAAVTLGATNQGMVAGDLVNTAARLQGVAPAGSVLVGESTQRLASGSIVFETVGDQVLKGKVAPVPAWRAIRVVAERGGRGRTDVLEAPFVGRDEDLRILKELYHATAREHRIRLVSVTGTGGTGKSRLAWEFEKYLDGIVGTTFWHHGRSPAYGEGITFWALGEMIRQRARLAETDDESTTRQKLAEIVGQYAIDSREAAWLQSAFLALLGIEAGPSDDLFAAWRTFFERMSATGPVVLVFEDLHWADSGTLDFIDHLLEWSRNVPIYIVTLARPELLEKRPAWGAGRRNFTSLFLDRLPDAAVREILSGLVPGLPPETQRSIVTRAEGLPLYAIETIRMLVDDGRLVATDDGTYRVVGDVIELAVPPTLTALIAARLDALDAADRGLMLDAAVIGQSFTTSGLAAVSGVPQETLDARLVGLVRSELLARQGDPLSPERGQFAFVQALVREVAYNTLSKKDRKSRHLAAARYFESLGTDEIAGALAGHYLSAHDLATEGAEREALATQARLALRGAAERAASLGAHDQAVTFCLQALSVTTDPREELELLERGGESASIAARWDDAERMLGTAISRYREMGDRGGVVRNATTLGRALVVNYRVREALDLIAPILAEVADLRDDPDVVRLQSIQARAIYLNSDPVEALEATDRVLVVAERLNLKAVLADTLSIRGSALIDVGRGQEGILLAEGAIKLAESAGLPHLAVRARNIIGIFNTYRDPRAAAASFAAGIAEARRLGNRGTVVRLTENAVENARIIGEWDWALSEVDGLLSGALGPEDRLFVLANREIFGALRGDLDASDRAEYEAATQAVGETSPGDVRRSVEDVAAWEALAAGRYDEAHARWLRGVELSPLNAPFDSAHSGLAAIWRGDVSATRTSLERLEATAAHGALIEARRAALGAAIAGFEGRADEALAGFRTVLEQIRALDLPVEEATLGISMLTVLGPNEPEALAAGAAARDILTRLRARALLERLEAAGELGRSRRSRPRVRIPEPAAERA